MELFEIIRKEHFNQDKSIRRIARERSIHRRVVRQALANANPPKRAKVERRCTVLTPIIKSIIDQILIDDKKAPRKQRHTNKRIFDRLVVEQQFIGSLSSVTQYVSKAKKEMGINSKAFVPQFHSPGEEAEVDWYEAMVDFPDGRKKIYFFQMRACHSGLEFHMAFERQNQQSFLEAHVAAFNYFGGVFKRISYDNLTSAVKKVLKGRKRIETENFITMRSHYLFEAFFCQPGIQGAHEKGGVEGGVGRFRRSHLTPVPQVNDLFALNELLLTACKQDEGRVITGYTSSVAERWQVERAVLKPLPNKCFDTTEVASPQVNSKSLVSVKGNYYSVPVNYVGQTTGARIGALQIHLYKKGKLIATHTRCYEQYKMITEIDHYLPLLKHKPGALSGSYALAQARQKNKWPEIYDKYWQALLNTNARSEANRLFVDFLWRARDYQFDNIKSVLEKAVATGAYQLDAIKLLMRYHLSQPDTVPKLTLADLGKLVAYERPMGSVDQYDALLINTGRCA